MTYIKRTARRARVVPWWALPAVAFVLASALLVMVPRPHAEAAPIPGFLSCVTDDGGANDYPGQRDLTQMCQGHANDNNDTKMIAWSWDELGTSGNNSMDACALFDTNNNGRADFAVCAITNGTPATHTATVTYTCNDSRADRCGGSAVTSGQSTLCSVTQTPTDPFNMGAEDTTAQCPVKLTDVGAATAVLMNVCAYPSSQPNSAPSDCVLAPDAPRLTLVKQVVTSPGSNVAVDRFTLSATRDSTTISGKTGEAAITGAAVSAGSWVLAEAADANTDPFTAGSWSCNVAGSLSGSTVTLSAGQNVICTISNTATATYLTLVKQVVTSTGSNVAVNRFTLSATMGSTTISGKTGNAAITGAAVSAGQWVLSEAADEGTDPYTAGSWSCNGGSLAGSTVTLSAGQNVTCTISNTASATYLTLVKAVTNTIGSNVAINRFTLSATKSPTTITGKTGDAAITGAVVEPGVWALSETTDVETDPYTASNWSCTAGVLVGSNLTLSAGQNATCTITNTAARVATSLATTPRVYPNDSATVSATSGGNVQGSVAFSLYGSVADCDAGGTNGRLFTQSVNLPGNATSSTVSTTNYPGVIGTTPYSFSGNDQTTFYWLVVFNSTNAQQDGRQSVCVERTTVTHVADAGPGTALPTN